MLSLFFLLAPPDSSLTYLITPHTNTHPYPYPNQHPKIPQARRLHVHGLSPELNSGSAIFAVDPPPPSVEPSPAAGAGASTGGGAGAGAGGAGGGSARLPSAFIDQSALVYTAAALGVVHDLSTNRQSFFSGHTDDVTCLTLSHCRQLAATGEAGRAPVIHVWSAVCAAAGGSGGGSGASNERPSLACLGKGVFSRGICALAFTYDATHVIGIGCDDAHTLAVLSVKTGACVATAGCLHGLPPAVKCLRSCPVPLYTEFVTKAHQGLCDVFVTAGEHHLKLWSFRRGGREGAEGLPNSAGAAAAAGGGVGGAGGAGLGAVVEASLQSKGALLGSLQSSVSPPKVYTCCEFLPLADKTCDLLAGGSNGLLYRYLIVCALLFSACVCALFVLVLCMFVRMSVCICMYLHTVGGFNHFSDPSPSLPSPSHPSTTHPYPTYTHVYLPNPHTPPVTAAAPAPTPSTRLKAA